MCIFNYLIKLIDTVIQATHPIFLFFWIFHLLWWDWATSCMCALVIHEFHCVCEQLPNLTPGTWITSKMLKPCGQRPPCSAWSSEKTHAGSWQTWLGVKDPSSTHIARNYLFSLVSRDFHAQRSQSLAIFHSFSDLAPSSQEPMAWRQRYLRERRMRMEVSRPRMETPSSGQHARLIFHSLLSLENLNFI